MQTLPPRRPPMASPRRALVELHTHSTYSDGELSPQALCDALSEQGVALWSLTDHDTCRGCHEAAAAAAAAGIAFIPGVEVSARHGRSVHILAYGLRWQDPALQEMFDERLRLRAARMTTMVERAQAHGFSLTLEDVLAQSPTGNLARPHLAQALLAQGHVTSVREAFDLYLHEGGPLHVPSPWPAPVEAIGMIHRFGGLAILAHPGLYGLDDQLPAWIDGGLDGIEVRHPSHTAEQVQRYTKLAEAHGLLKTASSDFHGFSVAPERTLGQTWMPQEWLKALCDRLGIGVPA